MGQGLRPVGRLTFRAGGVGSEVEPVDRRAERGCQPFELLELSSRVLGRGQEPLHRVHLHRESGQPFAHCRRRAREGL